MSNEIITTDLSEFGYQELREASELLAAYAEWRMSRSPNFLLGDAKVWFNKNNGSVFISDDNYDVGMINPDTGEFDQWFNCPECGHEGFREDMKHKGNAECKRYQKEIGV